jgi:sulfide:quinone oxidoreductase
VQRSPARVLIAGGGFAAVEAVLALRDLAGEAVHVELIAPERRLAYRPAAPAEGFAEGAPLSYDLATIAADAGAAYRRDRLEAVAGSARTVRLLSGAHLEYDALVIATGAQRRAAVPGALTFGDQRDVPHIRRMSDDMAAGRVCRAVFVVPGGATWALPAYELALHTAAFAEERGIDAELTLVTSEVYPLAAFGPTAGRRVRALLGDHGVRFLGRTLADHVERDGSLQLGLGERLAADVVIATPTLLARRVAGVPGSWQGFIPVDAHGRVEGMDGVYAAGDVTCYPIKHGGIAAQQADRIASAIAARVLWRREPPAGDEFELRARVLGGREALELHATLGADGRPLDVAVEPLDAPAVAPTAAAKVFGRYLTPYLAAAR